jgi:hypothetical protein
MIFPTRALNHPVYIWPSIVGVCDGLDMRVRCQIKKRIQNLDKTERHCRVVSTPALYSGGPGFKSWSGDRLFWLIVFIILLCPSRQMLDYIHTYIHSIALDRALASRTDFQIVRYIRSGVISPTINLVLATWYDHQEHLLAEPADTI